jgi:hypothetical protein
LDKELICMSDVAKSKRGRKPRLVHDENIFFGHDGTYVDVEATQSIREYEGLTPLPHNPPPGPKWQAKQGMARQCLNGAEYAVLACLIDRASKSKGACYPSQEFISRWTSRPVRTVRRAIKELSDKGIIRILHRGTTSNAYLINWPPLFSAYRQMKAMERHGDGDSDDQKWPGDDTKSGQEDRPKVAAKPMKGTYEEEPMTLRGPSDDEPYLVILDEEKIEEALQGRQEAEPSLLPEGPTEGEIQTKVSGYCNDVWDWVTEETFEAAANAEQREGGAGLAVIQTAVLAAKKGASGDD